VSSNAVNTPNTPRTVECKGCVYECCLGTSSDAAGPETADTPLASDELVGRKKKKKHKRKKSTVV